MVEARLTQDHLRWLVLIFIFASFSILSSYYIFPSQASILAITFLVISITPSLYRVMANEEVIVAKGGKRAAFQDKYGNLIMIMLVIAVGIFISFSFWHAVLPSDSSYVNGRCSGTLPCREAVFSFQESYLAESRGLDVLIGLMLLCFALSLFLGAGAILIIAWDVSSLVAGSSLGPMGFLPYLPQLLAFFLTGLAGTLLSFAIIRHEWRSRAFFIVFRDSMRLLGMSLLLIIVASFLF